MTDDFLRACIEQMIDLRHPLAALAGKLPWQQREQALAACLARGRDKSRGGTIALEPDLFGQPVVQAPAQQRWPPASAPAPDD